MRWWTQKRALSVIIIAGFLSILLCWGCQHYYLNATEGSTQEIITGTYVYEVSTEYQVNEDYVGYWIISYDVDGNCVENVHDVKSLSIDSVDIKETKSISDIDCYISEDFNQIRERNDTLKDMNYYGSIELCSAYYGYLELHIYGDYLTQYYCDDSGMIYFINSIEHIKDSDVKVVFELI